MTIKEKAKAYDEAIERAKKFYTPDSNNVNLKATLEMIFPELKEDEDEMIRKELINFVKSRLAGFPECDRFINWIESQGEQANEIYPIFRVGDYIRNKKTSDKVLIEQLDVKSKAYCYTSYGEITEVHSDFPFSKQDEWELIGQKIIEQKSDDKVEPKFKVGDWVVSPNGVYWHIDTIQNGRYEVTSNTGQCSNWPLDTNIYHLWTISDAKNGDILIKDVYPYYGTICLFKEFIQPFGMKLYCSIDKKGLFFPYNNCDCDYYHGYDVTLYPATKEQRDTLMKAMADAGYTFDFEKKELKKIENKNPLLSDFFKAEYERGKADAQKPAWSEEDENKLSLLEALCDEQIKGATSYSTMYREMHELKDWLESLKDRVQPKQEWKQENTDNLTAFENAMMHIGSSFFGQNAGLDPNNTNVIKEQANILLELVSKQEWNEEDEKYIASIIKMVEHCGFSSIVGITKTAAIAWLKSLRLRKQWKPSKEQLYYLSWIANIKLGDSVVEQEVSKHLNELYEQLKQL